jgi:hypothetical protein
MGVPIEPSADSRALAHAFREMFIALTSEGFTERQALQIIAEMMRMQGGES